MDILSRGRNYKFKRVERWKSPTVLTQPHLSGIRVKVTLTPLEEGLLVKIYSSKGIELFGVPHIKSALFDMFYASSVPIRFEGTLFNPQFSANKILGIASMRDNLHPDYQEIELYLTDLINGDNQLKRIASLNDLRSSLKDSIKIVQSYLVNSSRETLEKNLKCIQSLGFKRALIRNPSGLYTSANNILIVDLSKIA